MEASRKGNVSEFLPLSLPFLLCLSRSSTWALYCLVQVVNEPESVDGFS